MERTVANSEWKQRHANASEADIAHPLVAGVIEEFMDNMNIPDTGLPAYGIRKVALYAAQVARASALGFDPELLRLSRDEANSLQLDLAARAVVLGVPVHMLGPESDLGSDHG